MPRSSRSLCAGPRRPASPLVVKVGTSQVGAERALAHSGAIAGSDAAFDALCRAYGIMRCDDYGDWIEALEVFGAGRRPSGPNLVPSSRTRAARANTPADLAERAGIPLQQLPSDLAAATRRRLGVPRGREPDRLLRRGRAGARSCPPSPAPPPRTPRSTACF